LFSEKSLKREEEKRNKLTQAKYIALPASLLSRLKKPFMTPKINAI